jgi:tetratricopeptide (TPR) repeat protein
MNQHEQALSAAEQALTLAENPGVENRPAWAEALLAAGELTASMAGREREAVSHLQQFLQVSRKPLGVDVTWSRVYEVLGDAYFELSQYEQAANAFRSALQYNPYHPWETSLLFRIAQACYYQNSYEDTIAAVQQYITAVEQDGETVQDYRVYAVLGNAQFALERYAEAFASYEAALGLAPANASDLDKLKRYHQFALELR